MEGVIIRSKNRLRVVISVDLIMQSVAVEVDWHELEPVAQNAAYVTGNSNRAATSGAINA
jgi:hypothetical protein